MTEKFRPVYAVDFDGTLCLNAWPEIGAPNTGLIEQLKLARQEGVGLILWTCREGEAQAAAVLWCAGHGLYFDAVNANVPERAALYGGDSRRVSADIYIDDRAVSPMGKWGDEHGKR